MLFELQYFPLNYDLLDCRLSVWNPHSPDVSGSVAVRRQRGLQGRQLREAGHAEVIQELLRRRVERRAARRFAMAHDFHPLPVLERLDDVRGHGNAADRFDVAAGDGLLIRDDGEGLHHRT